MNNSVIGLDIAKNIFHMYTFVEGKSVKKKLRRAELLAFFANYPATTSCPSFVNSLAQ
jgi:transposase